MSKKHSKKATKKSVVEAAAPEIKATTKKPYKTILFTAIIAALIITITVFAVSRKRTAAIPAEIPAAVTTPQEISAIEPALTPVTSSISELNNIAGGAASKAVIKQIGLEEAKYLYDNRKAIFVDARSKEEFDALHIKGAISIPVNTAAEEIAKNRSILGQSGKIIVIYCHGIGCHLSDKTAYEIYDAGFKNVAIFFGGWNSWSDAKYPESR